MFLYFLLSCNDTKVAREKQASKDIDMNIGMVKTEGLFKEGAELALSEINQDLPQGRVLKLVVKDDAADINKGILNATEFANDLNTLAVLGHNHSYISIPVSAIYEFNGVLMFNPLATAKDLTENGYEYTFRTIPRDDILAAELVDYFIHENLNNVHICYVSDDYGKSFANAFEDRAESKGLDIVDRISYDIGDKREFNRIIKRWENYEYDSILFVGYAPEGINFYNVLHERGIDKPIVSSETMREEALLEEPCSIIDGKRFLSLFHSDDPDLEVQTFVNKFKDKFGQNPDMKAALAYDTIMVLGEAIKQASSFLPKDIATTLRSMEPYKGVTNSFSFDKKGDLANHRLVGIEKIEDNKYIFKGNY